MNRKHFILFFITLIYITVLNEITFAKQPEVRYFVSSSGVRFDFTCITKISGDTVYFMANKDEYFFLVDSISEYHHFKPGKTGQGVFLGLSAGLFLGAVFGSATSNEGNDSVTNLVWGAAICGVIGGVIGGFSGASKKIDVFFDYRNYSRNKKLESLNKIYNCK